MKSLGKTIKKLLIFAGIITVLLVATSISGIGDRVGQVLAQPSDPQKQDIEQNLIDGLENAAKILNKNTPRMIDKETSMGPATIGPGLRVNINYTLPNYSSSEFTSSQIIQHIRPTLKNYACSKPNMKVILQYGASIVYSYYGNDGILITSIPIVRNDCWF
jgi:hypothetical protein